MSRQISHFSSSSWASRVIWIALGAGLFLTQCLYSLALKTRVSFEELDNIKGAFWLLNKSWYAPGFQNMSWYALLWGYYELFGFSLYAGIYIRLALSVLFLICSAHLLRKYCGPVMGLIPFLIIGLSPTLLYLNTLGQWGIDLQLFAVLLVLLDNLSPSTNVRTYFLLATIGAFLLFSCLSYPSFMMYLPAVFAFTFFSSTDGLRRCACVSLGFLLPLVFTPFFISDWPHFFVGEKTALFLGGGQELAIANFFPQLKQLFQDLFIRANSYFVVIPFPDFSAAPGIVTFLLIPLLGIAIARHRPPLRPSIGSAMILLISGLTLPNFASNGLPGLRRSTAVLAATYLLFIIVMKSSRGLRKQTLVVAMALFLVSHHLIAASPNLAFYKRNLRLLRSQWLAGHSDPEIAAKEMIETVREGKPILCPSPPCCYDKPYSLVSSHFYWNENAAPPIYAVPWKTNVIVEMTEKTRGPFFCSIPDYRGE